MERISLLNFKNQWLCDKLYFGKILLYMAKRKSREFSVPICEEWCTIGVFKPYLWSSSKHSSRIYILFFLKNKSRIFYVFYTFGFLVVFYLNKGYLMPVLSWVYNTTNLSWLLCLDKQIIISLHYNKMWLRI